MFSLRTASDYCRQLTERSSSSFYYAFFFVPREEREALYAIYAFCRLVDDAVDEAAAPGEAQDRLAGWRRQVALVYTAAPGGDQATPHPVAERLRSAVRRFPIRRADLEAVIEGCAWDLERSRYHTWEELEAYCHRVASAVGLMCIEVFGYGSPRARDYARDLGVALQLTNILRDLGEDAARGRIYLPTEDLAAFGVTDDDILAGRRTPAVMRLLRFEAQRARQYYLRARAAVAEADRRSLVVAEIMGDIYYRVLVELERAGFAPGERAKVPAAKKAAIALKRYVSTRLGRVRRTASS